MVRTGGRTARGYSAAFEFVVCLVALLALGIWIQGVLWLMNGALGDGFKAIAGALALFALSFFATEKRARSRRLPPPRYWR